MRLLQPTEIETVYKPLFKSLFGYYDENHIPRTVLLHENNLGEITGFMSGFKFNRDTFYMQYGGATKFAGHRKFWEKGEAWMINNGVKYLITTVENTNTQWQRVLLKLSFVPYGMKTTQGKIYVDYWKSLVGRV